MAEIPTEIDACQPDEDDTFLGFAFLNNWRNELFQINLNACWRWEGWLTSTTLGICILLQGISGTWFCNEGNFLHLIGKCLVYVACENYFSVIVVRMPRNALALCSFSENYYIQLWQSIRRWWGVGMASYLPEHFCNRIHPPTPPTRKSRDNLSSTFMI